MSGTSYQDACSPCFMDFDLDKKCMGCRLPPTVNKNEPDYFLLSWKLKNGTGAICWILKTKPFFKVRVSVRKMIESVDKVHTKHWVIPHHLFQFAESPCADTSGKCIEGLPRMCCSFYWYLPITLSLFWHQFYRVHGPHPIDYSARMAPRPRDIELLSDIS